MFFFRKKKSSIQIGYDKFDSLINLIEGLGFRRVNESQAIVGSVDLVSIDYKKDDNHINVTLDNYSDIDVTGDKEGIELIKSRLEER